MPAQQNAICELDAGTVRQHAAMNTVACSEL
jgi:hypothetical protein